MKKRLLRNIRSVVRNIRDEGSFDPPNARSHAAAERLEAFALDIERASDIVVGAFWPAVTRQSFGESGTFIRR